MPICGAKCRHCAICHPFPFFKCICYRLLSPVDTQWNSHVYVGPANGLSGDAISQSMAQWSANQMFEFLSFFSLSVYRFGDLALEPPGFATPLEPPRSRKCTTFWGSIFSRTGKFKPEYTAVCQGRVLSVKVHYGLFACERIIRDKTTG